MLIVMNSLYLWFAGRHEPPRSIPQSSVGVEPVLNNAPLTQHVDHINGDHLDSGLSNLRFPCPHCHT